MKAITARQGAGHITPLHDAMWHRGITGKDTCAFPKYETFKATIVSNNIISIGSGIGSFQGRFFCVEPNTADEITIANGSQGMNRVDLIVARWETDTANNTQSCSWKVIQGTPTAGTPTIPDIENGDLDNGDLSAEEAWFKVELSGVTISAVTPIFELWHDPSHFGAAFSAKGSEESVALGNSVITKVTLDKSTVCTDDNFTFSNGGIKCPYDGVVLVTASIYIDKFATSGNAGLQVWLNDTEVATSYGYYNTVSGASKIMSVKAGDVLYLNARAGVSAVAHPIHENSYLGIMYIQ